MRYGLGFGVPFVNRRGGPAPASDSIDPSKIIGAWDFATSSLLNVVTGAPGTALGSVAAPPWASGQSGSQTAVVKELKSTFSPTVLGDYTIGISLKSGDSPYYVPAFSVRNSSFTDYDLVLPYYFPTQVQSTGGSIATLTGFSFSTDATHHQYAIIIKHSTRTIQIYRDGVSVYGPTVIFATTATRTAEWFWINWNSVPGFAKRAFLYNAVMDPADIASIASGKFFGSDGHLV